MNENKSNEEKYYREFENIWNYQQGSLMLKNENSSLEWKRTIARYFYYFGRKAGQEDIDKLKDLVSRARPFINIQTKDDNCGCVRCKWLKEYDEVMK